MKRILFFIIALIPALAQAQYKYYRDSSYNQTFNYLSGSTSINNGVFWDDPDYAFPIGFNFHLFQDSNDSLFISSYLGLGAVLSLHAVDSNTVTSSGIMAHGSDLQDRDITMTGSNSPISYNLTGTSPNRICKVEWKNAGFFNPIDAGTSYTDSMDLQLWIYETSDIIEVRFGNGNYVSTATDLYDGGQGPWVSIFDSVDVNFDARIFYSFSDSVTTPILDSFSTISTFPGMIGNPVAGSVYRFIPKNTSTGVGYTSYNTINASDLLYIQSKNELRIDIFNQDNFQYTVCDLQGHVIMNGQAYKGRTLINMSNLVSGMYIVRLNSNTENKTFKFVR